MRSGIRVGVDVGKVRIGVSQSDPDGVLAFPVETVPRDNSVQEGIGSGDALGSSRGRDIARIVEVCAEVTAMEVVVGLPISLSGSHTLSTDDAVQFASRLANSVNIPVRLVDERLSTVSAQNSLRANNRRIRSSRPIIDQLAAVIVLQQALDTERDGGTLPGELVTPIKGM